MEIKNDDNPILLEETFYVLTKKKSLFKVQLSRKYLSIIKESEQSVKEQMIPIRDIIGCRCLRGKKQSRRCVCQFFPSSSTNLEVIEDCSLELDHSDSSAYLNIYAYIFQGSKVANKRRDRTIITLRFRSFDRYEDNNKEALRWKTVLKKLIKGEAVSNVKPGFTLSNKPKDNRKLLILCNPKSGQGKGKQIFQQNVTRVLQDAEIPFDLYLTKHANFAREFVRTNNLYQWSGIVTVGGDGIVFEVINGIFERLDWSEIIKSIPLGVIPAGSGNGLARSIAHYYSEPYFPTPYLPAALAVVRNVCETMDLVRVETNMQIMFSFLSVGWGLLSDIDIESERLRMLGGQRFVIWSLARLIGLRSYGGKLWYLPTSVSSNNPKDHHTPTNNVENNIDLPIEVNLETQTDRQRTDSWYSANSPKSAYLSANGSSYQSTMDSGGNGCIPSTEKPRMYGPASQIPCLPAPLPPSWKCITGRFIMVHASYQSHLGEDCLLSPEATLNDGKIWLLIVHAGATRSELLHFLLGLSTGAHATSKTQGGAVELLPVSAFRIEPDMSEVGYMTVDGEHVEYGPIQAEVFPSLVRIMVP